MAHNSNNEENAFATWTADLSSPIHKHLTLKQVRSKFFVRCPFVFILLT